MKTQPLLPIPCLEYLQHANPNPPPYPPPKKLNKTKIIQQPPLLPDPLRNHTIPIHAFVKLRLRILLALDSGALPHPSGTLGVVDVDPAAGILVDLNNAPAADALTLGVRGDGVAILHGAVPVAGEGEKAHAQQELGSEQDKVENKEEGDHGHDGDDVIRGPALAALWNRRVAVAAAGDKRRAAEGAAEHVVDVLECCGGGWG